MYCKDRRGNIEDNENVLGAENNVEVADVHLFLDSGGEAEDRALIFWEVSQC